MESRKLRSRSIPLEKLRTQGSFQESRLSSEASLSKLGQSLEISRSSFGEEDAELAMYVDMEALEVQRALKSLRCEDEKSKQYKEAKFLRAEGGKQPTEREEQKENGDVQGRIFPEFQRCKAIRDKNLKNRGRTSAETKFTIKMDEIASTEEKTSTETVEVNKIKDLQNVQISEQESKGKKDELTNGVHKKEMENGVTNGHEEKVCFVKSPDIPSTDEDSKIDLNSFRGDDDDNLCLRIDYEDDKEVIDLGHEKISNNPSNENLVEHSGNESPQKTDGEDLVENSGNESPRKSVEEAEEQIESDEESTISDTKKSVASSSEDVSEAPEGKDEDSEEEEEEEEINVDKVSTSTSSNSGSEEDDEPMEDAISQEAPLKAEIRKPDTTNKIPQSLPTSASSFKTAYGGSISKISGRRAVRGLDRSVNRKRKADDSDPSSIPSPRWKFFRPAISNLLSPRNNTLNYSSTSTPFKNIEDSMTVNFDEDTIYSHMNDPDLSINQSKKSTSSNKSRWGCSIM